MSKFNQARFNRAPFNISRDEGTTWASGLSKTTFGFAYVGATYYTWGNSAVRVLADLSLNRGRMNRGGAANTFAASADIISETRPWGTVETIFEEETINLSQNVGATGQVAEEFIGVANLSQNIWATGEGSAEFSTEAKISQLIDAGGNSGVIFAVSADVISLKELVCEFPDLVLRPGQELVIDAGNYSVYLDGENALHLQQGDWLDELNRGTQAITISATGIGRVSASILYTERYL